MIRRKWNWNFYALSSLSLSNVLKNWEIIHLLVLKYFVCFEESTFAALKEVFPFVNVKKSLKINRNKIVPWKTTLTFVFDGSTFRNTDSLIYQCTPGPSCCLQWTGTWCPSRAGLWGTVAYLTWGSSFLYYLWSASNWKL